MPGRLGIKMPTLQLQVTGQKRCHQGFFRNTVCCWVSQGWTPCMTVWGLGVHFSRSSDVSVLFIRYVINISSCHFCLKLFWQVGWIICDNTMNNLTMLHHFECVVNSSGLQKGAKPWDHKAFHIWYDIWQCFHMSVYSDALPMSSTLQHRPY